MQILRDVEQRTAASTEPVVRTAGTARANGASGLRLDRRGTAMLLLVARTAQNPRPAWSVPTVEVHTGTLERILRLTGSTVGENSMTLLAPHLRGSRTRGGEGALPSGATRVDS